MKVKLEMVLELGEMDVGELATAIRREVRAMDIPNPDGGVMFLEHLSVVVKEVASSENLPEVPTCTKSQTADLIPARPPTPIGWSDTDWIKHLQEHPLAGLHINQGSMDAAADAYEAEYNAAHNAVHVTPAIDEGCYHDWENGEDGNPERCSKCGLSFMRFIHSCCP